MSKGSLKITITRPDGPPTVYYGEAEWHTDSVPMILLSGPPLKDFAAEDATWLEVHSTLCRAAALAAGLDTIEEWNDEGFKGGRLR